MPERTPSDHATASPRADTEYVRVRPNPRKYFRRLATQAPLLLIAVVGLFVRAAHYSEGAWWWPLPLLTIFIGFAGVNAMAFRNEALFVGGDSLGEVTWWGRTRRFARQDVDRIVRLGIRQWQSAPAPKWVVSGPRGRLVVLDDRMWDDSDLEAIWRRLGIRPEGSFGDVISYGKFEERFPEA